MSTCDKRSPEAPCNKSTLVETVSVQNGAVYALIIEDNARYTFLELVHPNNVTMAWMLPQYFLITLGEIMFTMSGSEFSYGQAAPSMKSTLQACWLTTAAFGNVIDILISGTELVDNAAYEFFLYAGLMFIFLLVFIYFASSYQYVERDKIELAKMKASALKFEAALQAHQHL